MPFESAWICISTECAFQNGDVLVPANPDPSGKWPLKRRERERERERESLCVHILVCLCVRSFVSRLIESHAEISVTFFLGVVNDVTTCKMS